MQAECKKAREKREEDTGKIEEIKNKLMKKRQRNLIKKC
jgi:hypothetical protein